MPTLYEFWAGDWSKTYRSLKAAKAGAREAIKDGYGADFGIGEVPEIAIDRVTIPPVTLDLLVTIINAQGGQYVSDREERVAVVKGRRRT